MSRLVCEFSSLSTGISSFHGFSVKKKISLERKGVVVGTPWVLPITHECSSSNTLPTNFRFFLLPKPSPVADSWRDWERYHCTASAAAFLLIAFQPVIGPQPFAIFIRRFEYDLRGFDGLVQPVCQFNETVVPFKDQLMSSLPGLLLVGYIEYIS